MKNFCSTNLPLITAVVTIAFGIIFLSACPPFSDDAPTNTDPNSKGWKVWMKSSPCSGGRTDWISVAKKNPTEGGGGSFWVLADEIMTPMACTTAGDDSCTFADANASAATIRASSKFKNYCCRDYSVWENTTSGEQSVVKGMGSAGYGWRFVKGELCCEEAEELTGKTGLCGGTTAGGKTGYIGCFKDTPDFDLNGFLERSQSNTPEACIATCRLKGFAYAAVQYGESCLCGNTYGKYGAADNCDYKCTGDGGKICGGYNANSVFGTGIAVSGGGGSRNPGGGTDSGDDKGGGKHDGEFPQPTPTPVSGGGTWTLVSVTAIPETPTGGYSYNAQGSTVHLDVYNGDKHDFQWTKPPSQIDANGFTVSISARCQSQPKNVCASLIGVRGDGLESDTPGGERKAEANGADGSVGSGQKSVTFKPNPNSNELEVEVGMMWGAVRFIYKYRRAN